MLWALTRAARPLAHANIAPALLFGQALAFATTGRFSWTALITAQLFGVIDHLVIVFANDYADRDADRMNTTPTPFSGGSRVLPDGQLSENFVRTLAIGAALALVAFPFVTTLALLPHAVAALALIGAYSYPPLRLSYRGGGELLQGLGVGVVLPLVGLTAQGAPIDAHMIACLAPTFVLAVGGNVLTSIPDEEADRRAGKGSPAARWGSPRARIASIVLHLAAVVLGAVLLPIPISRAAIVILLATVLQVLAFWQRSTLVFVVLGGATESIAILGFALALIL